MFTLTTAILVIVSIVIISMVSYNRGFFEGYTKGVMDTTSNTLKKLNDTMENTSDKE